MIARHAFVLCVVAAPAVAAEPDVTTATRWQFESSFTKEAHTEPFTGRVYVFFSRGDQEPRLGPNWFRPEPFISLDVTDLKPGETVTLSDADTHLLSYPKPLAELNLVGFRAQAVMRFNPWERTVGIAPGNGYSGVMQILREGTIPLQVVTIVPERTFPETDWTKLLQVRSEKLSEFYGHDVFLNAAVRLPASYFDGTEKTYPTIFEIPGFGGTHFRGIRNAPIAEQNNLGVEFIRVLLDPSCPLGHHVFADSANNGPVGSALVNEFLPAFHKKFRAIDDPKARFLTGHSSGGWSSLWLQVAYPETFGGTWSTAPDPVDFRDFQQINLYDATQNMYVDAGGNERPLARVNGRVVLWYRGFDRMEQALGPGGQLHSFEACFSPRDKDGRPLLAWDRETGEIDTSVTEHWKKYDIRFILEENWKSLAPKLQGKLHVFMGTEDTFYLEGATVLLKQSLEDLKSDAVVEMFPGRTHFDLLQGGLAERIQQEMAETFVENFPKR